MVSLRIRSKRQGLTDGVIYDLLARCRIGRPIHGASTGPPEDQYGPKLTGILGIGYGPGESKSSWRQDVSKVVPLFQATLLPQAQSDWNPFHNSPW